MTCALCGRQVYRVRNPRTGRIFLVDSFTGKVSCPANPARPTHTLDELPSL